jgi:hypothetical protein
MGSSQNGKVREATQPERDIQKAVIDADTNEKIQLLKVPDGFNDDLARLAAALGSVAGLNSRTREIVAYLATTCAKLRGLPELFDREVHFLSNSIYFFLQASLAPRDIASSSDTVVDLKPFFEAILLDDVEAVKPWLIPEAAAASSLRVKQELVPRCLPLAFEWRLVAVPPELQTCELVEEYSLLELSAGAGAAKCMRFFAEFLHCPVTGVALQLAVRAGHVELVRDLMNRLERVELVSESVFLDRALAAVEHC